jgi:coproporphyrinogen III oxidase
MDLLPERKSAATAWFASLQTRLIAAMEAIEDECPGPFVEEARRPGRFEIATWARTDHTGKPGGGGRMAILRGRVFEKMGAHTSTVFGTFAPEFASQIPGADLDPRSWASEFQSLRIPGIRMRRRFT